MPSTIPTNLIVPIAKRDYGMVAKGLALLLHIRKVTKKVRSPVEFACSHHAQVGFLQLPTPT